MPAGPSTRRGTSPWARDRPAAWLGSSASSTSGSATRRRRTPPCWCWRAGRFPTRGWCGSSPTSAASGRRGCWLLIAPTASIAGLRPGRRALGRDRAPQDAGARVRRPKRAERRGRVPARAGGEERPPRHRLDERLHPLRHPRLLRRPRGRRRGGRDGRAAAGLDVAGLRHPLLRDLQARRQRVLQDRPDAVQPGGGGRQQPGLRARLPRRPPRPRRAAGVVRRWRAATLAAREARREGRHPGLAVRLARGPAGTRAPRAGRGAGGGAHHRPRGRRGRRRPRSPPAASGSTTAAR